MSANTIARWNAISLSRTESDTKRFRPEEEEEPGNDEDDDIPIVSRTPSPEAMHIDGDSSRYDEYVHGTPREVITVETKIKPTNKGFAMLAKLGWSEGQSLGISGDGRVDPIPFHIKRDLTGLGKTSQDVRMIETTVSQRRGLDSERQQKETEDQRRAREDLVARRSALESEISTTLKAFYCTLCDKQFKNVSQYDEHTNSYAHHHKARFKDMQANIRLKPKEEVDKRKEKERKREEKELRKIAAANGIKMAKPGLVSAASLDAGSSNSMEIDNGSPPPVKRTGWTKVSFTLELPQLEGRVVVPPVPAALTVPGTSQINPNMPTRPIQSGQQTLAPLFRTAGWTSLDTGSSHEMPPPPPGPKYSPPSPPPGSWVSGPRTGVGLNNSPADIAVPPSIQPPTQPPPPIPEAVRPVRSGWQQFQKSAIRKR